MENLTNKIEQFLSENSRNAISVSCGSLRLRKKNANTMRYAFLLSDINSEYGSVSNLLRSLPDKGFTENATISLRKCYGSGSETTYHTVREFSIKITKRNEEPRKENYEAMHTQAPQTPQIPQPQTAMPMGLGYTPVATAELLEHKVTATRYEDLKNRHEELKEELKDAKSKLRTKNEEFAALKLKYETVEERGKLELEKDRLERKSFWETDGLQKALPSFAPALGALLEKFAGPSNAGALGAPATDLSPQKQQLVAYVQTPDCTEEQAQLLALIINGYSDELVKAIVELLNKKK